MRKVDRDSPDYARQWDEYWAKRKAQRHAAVGARMVVITRQESRLQIACPYDEMFVILAQGAGATWRHKTSVWSFPSGQWVAGLDAAVRCFGRGKLTPDWLHYLDTENAKL